MNLLRGSVSVERWVIAVLVLICLATVATSLQLARNARDLETRALSAEAARDRQIEIQPGTKVDLLSGYDLEGREVHVPFGGTNAGAVLFVFSPDCPACDGIWEEWRSIANSARQKGYRPVAVNLSNRISREDKQLYVRSNELQEMQIVANPTTESILALRLRLTPQIIVIRADGTVGGALSGGLSSMPSTARQAWVAKMLG